ncbi:CRISPR system precrRNA processing endoribonuclease RAMP protein Cas6 [Sulfidibacter corallicola]|uniref:CRISPR system precrRNA processing endoribonuclease RAMP protein Cas6 n=1 Tax=Sulfidibacter corallicola TaxID=2818388 RepID=A0A8A4TRM9_SULCO|nr:CRISPR system precrRNA processing endoribonuclease RAMP protein Cas6 [Sulfidibacter corallicola]QTD51661.1 CRISPR system precrRNA processing endoribonuclease RAMP protein Cas6 [Sulfidibacter corallicola]
MTSLPWDQDPKPAHDKTKESKDTTSPTPNPREPGLPMSRFRMRFAVLRRAKAPHFPGHLWRSMLTRHWRNHFCELGHGTCVGCEHPRTCLFGQLFENQDRDFQMPLVRGSKPPNPWVIRPSLKADWHQLLVGRTVEVDFSLFGSGPYDVARLFDGLQSMQARSFQFGSGRLRLRRVIQLSLSGERLATWDGAWQEPPQTPDAMVIPPAPRRVRLVFETPTRLKFAKELVYPDTFAFHMMFRVLTRRISMLCACHGGRQPRADFRALIKEAAAIRGVTADLSWRDGDFPGKHKRAMGGLVGILTLEGDRLEPFWPWLWLGQFVGVGKGAPIGLGRYRLEVEDAVRSPSEESRGTV